MKKIILPFIALIAFEATIQAQQTKTVSKDSLKVFAPQLKKEKEVAPKKDWSKVDLSKRPADHFIFQYGLDGWAGSPDSVKTKGFCRHFNFYVMIDKPFKSDPHYSLAYGAGIGTSNIFFNNEIVHIESSGSSLPFTDVSNSDHFNKFKLTTVYFEVPAEIRMYENPENKNSGWKGSIGVKAGILLKAYTKGKNWESASGSSYFGSAYVQKVSSNRFINGTKVAVSGRIGYGFVSLHGDFNVLGVIKNGMGPTINAYSIGLSIGGL